MLAARQVADFIRMPSSLQRHQAGIEFYLFLARWREDAPVSNEDSEVMVQHLFRECMKPPPYIRGNAFLLLAWAVRFQAVATPLSFWAALFAATGLAAVWTWALIRHWIST